MRMRMGAPLVVAMVSLLAAVQSATASHCGAARFGSNPCCDAQSCFPACQQQSRVCYKLVWDTVQEKRWHTCYKTVQETVNKQVTKTLYREECKQDHEEGDGQPAVQERTRTTGIAALREHGTHVVREGSEWQHHEFGLLQMRRAVLAQFEGEVSRLVAQLT